MVGDMLMATCRGCRRAAGTFRCCPCLLCQQTSKQNCKYKPQHVVWFGLYKRTVTCFGQVQGFWCPHTRHWACLSPSPRWALVAPSLDVHHIYFTVGPSSQESGNFATQQILCICALAELGDPLLRQDLEEIDVACFPVQCLRVKYERAACNDSYCMLLRPSGKLIAAPLGSVCGQH